MARFVDARDDFMGARLFAGSALAPVCSSHPFSWFEEIRRSRHERCVRDRASFLVYLVGGAEGETNGKGPVYLVGRFVWFLSLFEPDKPDKPNRPDKPDPAILCQSGRSDDECAGQLVMMCMRTTSVGRLQVVLL